VQTGLLAADPGDVSSVPCGQAVLSKHTDWFGCEVKVPCVHAAHIRSAVADGVLVTYCPAGQSLHGWQATTFIPTLNVPLAQAVQTRFALELPSAPTN
jgi:hypothetical protein